MADKNILEVAEPVDDQGNANYAVYKGRYPQDRPEGIPRQAPEAPPDGGWALQGHMIQPVGIDFPSLSRPLLLSPDHSINGGNKYRAGWDTMPRRILLLPETDKE